MIGYFSRQKFIDSHLTDDKIDVILKLASNPKHWVNLLDGKELGSKSKMTIERGWKSFKIQDPNESSEHSKIYIYEEYIEWK